MTERELLKAVHQLEQLPATVEDWRDLYETIEGYKRRHLARAIAASPQRDELLTAIQTLASRTDG